MADAFTKLTTELQALEQKALNLGLYVTARAINGSIRAAGWEKSGNLDMAVKRAIDRISPNGDP